MTFGVLGDLHGDIAAARHVMRRHPEVPFWLCVGDVGDDDGRYGEVPAPLYWIKGNNEDFRRIEAWQRGEPPPVNLHYLPNAVSVKLETILVAGLGGTHAPKWYDRRAAELPGSRRPDGRDDKRRHFVREEVEACARLEGIDVFLSHEAPRPFIVSPPGRPGRVDAGKTAINEVLAAMNPKLHFFGHHHRFTDAVRQGVRSIGLDLVSRSYVLVDARRNPRAEADSLSLEPERVSYNG